MASIKKPASFRAHKQTTLAMGVSAALMTPFNANAEEVFSLDALTIEERTADTNPYAEPNAPYKAKKSGDDRYKRDLADLPKNISVLTSTQIEESGYSDLREILDAQPGITLGTGENGNAFGDRYIIRGQEARSDVFVDGLRDPGMTIRESFATEQVEITKGPDSSFGGRGTTGGAVNSVTKKASTDYDFNKGSMALGSDKHQRITMDSNHVINDTTAVRANVLFSAQETPDRSPAESERQGVALSLVHQASDKLDIAVDYYRLEADDIPDLGAYFKDHDNDSSTARIIEENPPVYAQEDDFMQSDVETFTAHLDYQIDPDMRVSNTTRYGTTDNGYVATGTRQTTALTFDGVDVNDFATTRLSTHQGWQEVDYLVNQTNLHWDKTIAGKKHELLFGFEHSDHKVLNGVYDITSNGNTNCTFTGRGGTVSDGYCIKDASGNLVNGVNSLLDSDIARGDWDSDWAIQTQSFSVMDTVDINDKLTMMGGIRADMYDFELSTQGRNTGTYEDSQTVFNYHLAGTYKVRPDVIVYASYATASDINGGESDVGTSSGYGGAAINDDGSMEANPEKTRSIEIGTKWNVMDGKLLATAALFNIKKTDVMEGDGYESTGSFNTGGNEVQGVEFGLAGNITPKLSAHAGLAIMESEITESATAENIGKDMANFAEVSWSAQFKYQANRDWALGLAAKYEGEKKVGQPDSAGSDTYIIPDYTVFDAFANYRFSRQLNARLNVGNLTNETYYTAGYRSGDFLYLGDARTVRLTLNYDF